MSIPISSKALAKLGGELQVPRDRPFAFLVAEQYRDKEGSPSIFEFYANPEKISYNFSSNWTKSGAAGVSKQTVQWYNGENSQITFPDLWLDSHNKRKSIAPLLDALKKLKDVEPGTRGSGASLPGKRQPPVLYFKWGARTIGPIVMTECTIDEESWINGLCTGARVTLDFIEIALPDETRSIVPSIALNDNPANTTKLPVRLSDGVVKQSTKKAREWVSKNANKIAGALGSSVKKGEKAYAMATNPNTGLVTIKSGANSGVVGIYDGKDFYSLNDIKSIKKQELLGILQSKSSLNSTFGKTIGELMKPGNAVTGPSAPGNTEKPKPNK